MLKLAVVRELDPVRDAARYAEQLMEMRSELFAPIEGGVASVAARMAARVIATDHLGEICRLPREVAYLERSLEIATMTASERLVRLAGLAYLVCDRDLLRDDLPAGYGLIDDCIALRGARMATPAVNESDRLVEDLRVVQYLSLAAPDPLLPAIEEALTNSAEVQLRTRGLPESVVEAAIRNLVDHPPADFPVPLMLPSADDPSRLNLDSPLQLAPGQLVSVDGERLHFEFANGTLLRREPDGSLHFD